MPLRMRFGFRQTAAITAYLIEQKLRGRKHFPLVLMLEPLHRCNLQCLGCGRIKEYAATMDREMSLGECLEAVDTSGAPVVSICGGEPLLYRHLVPLCEEVARRKRIIYLCTNALKLTAFLDRLTPGPYLKLNVHLDGLETHDAITQLPGSAERAIDAIGRAKAKGFYVCTNTTIYRQTDIEEVGRLFDRLTQVGVDGLLVSPGYEYEAVHEQIFLRRQEVHAKFRQLAALQGRYRYLSTPTFLRFLRGEKAMSCSPWGNVTRNPAGWKGPCYLITDSHYPSYRELIDQTPWDRYAQGEDPRCLNCMVHCGFEATVALGTNNGWRDYLDLIRWNVIS